MKKIIVWLLVASMAVGLVACGSNSSGSDTASEKDKTAEQSDATKQEDTEKENSEEEQLKADEAELAAYGDVSVQNGLVFVSINVPKDIAGDDVTQESLDAGAGENYTSAKLNEDGSVTYLMTRAQHAAMLDSIRKGVDEGIQEMVNSDDYNMEKITYNDDLTQYDVTLSTTDLGFTDSFGVLALYMYSGMYGIFSGKQPDNVVVNYYNPSGNLITTANSKDMESGDGAQ